MHSFISHFILQVLCLSACLHVCFYPFSRPYSLPLPWQAPFTPDVFHGIISQGVHLGMLWPRIPPHHAPCYISWHCRNSKKNLKATWLITLFPPRDPMSKATFIKGSIWLRAGLQFQRSGLLSRCGAGQHPWVNAVRAVSYQWGWEDWAYHGLWKSILLK